MSANPRFPSAAVALVVRALDKSFGVKTASAKAVGFVTGYESACDVGISVAVVTASLHSNKKTPPQ